MTAEPAAPAPVGVDVNDLYDDFLFERKQVIALREVLTEIFTCLATGDCALHDDEQVFEWRQRAGMDDR